MNAKKVSTKVEKEQPQFRVVGDSIVWDYKRGEITLSVEDLDHIFYEYSKHGLNMSQVQVQNKHGLDALQWQSFKRTFDLVKDSDVFSPYSLSLVSDKAACDMIAQKIGEKYNPKNMRAVIAYESDKQRGKALDKVIKESASRDYEWQVLSNALLEYTSEAKAVKVRKTAPTKGIPAYAHICDIHGGAEIKASRGLQAYNYQVIEKRLKAIAEDINSKQPTEVTLGLNGDFIETFTGLNHINSWQGIAKTDGYGQDALIRVTEILVQFISQVNNVKEVLLTSGNHDRITSSNKEDVDGGVAKLVFVMLKARFNGLVDIDWDADVITRKIGGVGIIQTHGHLNMAKNAANLVKRYGYKGCYNLVMKAHLHSLIIKDDNEDYRDVVNPSIFTGNPYSKKGGWGSRSGYSYTEFQDKLPQQTFVTLH